MDQNTAEPIRVLQINSGSRSFGGVSSFLYNVYSNIDRKQVQFDFLSPNVTTYEIHRDEIEEMGGRIYELGVTGSILTKKTRLYKRLYQFLTQHKYSIVHINSGLQYWRSEKRAFHAGSSIHTMPEIPAVPGSRRQLLKH